MSRLEVLFFLCPSIASNKQGTFSASQLLYRGDSRITEIFVSISISWNRRGINRQVTSLTLATFTSYKAVCTFDQGPVQGSMAPVDEKEVQPKSPNSLWVGLRWLNNIVRSLILNSDYLFLCGSLLILLEAAVLVAIISYVPCELSLAGEKSKYYYTTGLVVRKFTTV